MTRPTSRQPSSIDRLPVDIRTQLQELLRDPRVTQLDATEQINRILAEDGHAEQISKSAVNRYSMRMAKVGRRLQESREVAQMWIGKLGATPQGEVGNLVNEILRTLSFDISLILQDGELNAESAPEVVGMLKDLALTSMRLEQSANLNVEREKEIRAQERERLQKQTLEAVETSGPMTAEQLKDKIREVYGV
ncbi:MAG: DUF3486 family protein [Desulfuromonadaceae bacterium]|nr:DUF3486 family protein [Desulfuromonadaceae bacterium]